LGRSGAHDIGELDLCSTKGTCPLSTSLQNFSQRTMLTCPETLLFHLLTREGILIISRVTINPAVIQRGDSFIQWALHR